jgi:hypothetical protein
LHNADGYVQLNQTLSSMGRRLCASNHWDPRQWIIRSDLPPDAIRDQLRPLIFAADRLLVVAIQDGAWAGINADINGPN